MGGVSRFFTGEQQAVAPAQRQTLPEPAAQPDEPEAYAPSRASALAKAFGDRTALFEPPKINMVKGPQLEGVQARLPESYYRNVPLPKGKRLLSSDDYTNLVLEALRLEAQARVTRMSKPNLSGLLG